MEKEAVRILKGQNVKLEGRLQLEVPHAGARLMKRKGESSEPGARIVDNQPEFATIEITCSCGTKMDLRCEYVPAEASVAGPGPESNSQPNNANGE
ncbi:MAG: hypothetical protein ACYS4W_00055 [Planctomycetota bacterium]|jgi:hypothetical protein